MEKRLSSNVQKIERLIHVVRYQKVMIDSDLAKLYGVETRALKQAVRRNEKRFPNDFMFELTREEIMRMSQIVTSSKIKFSKSVHAFTEQGVAMLSSVLNSERAIDVNIEIMRAFVRVREMLAARRNLDAKLKDLENHIKDHDDQIQTIFEAMRQLMLPSEKPGKPIGFEIKEPKQRYGNR